MPEQARAFLKQLTDFWAGLPTPKRIALVFFTSVVLLGVVLLSVLGSREHYATLYSELSTEDASQIVEKLKTAQVPYQLEANGTVIQVPEDKVAGLRLAAAAWVSRSSIARALVRPNSSRTSTCAAPWKASWPAR